MIEKEIIDSLPDHEKANVVAGLMLLGASPIFELQRQALVARLVEGSDSEQPDLLANRIVETRRKTHALTELQQLCEQISKDARR